MKNTPFSIIILALLFFSCNGSSSKMPVNKFYAQNTVSGLKNAPDDQYDKALILKGIGFDGLEGNGYKDFLQTRDALRKAGMEMTTNYVPLVFGEKGITDSISASEIRTMIKATGRGEIIYFHVKSEIFKDNRQKGDSVLSGILGELSDIALPYNVRLCIYPHVNTYCETLEHSVRLAAMTGRKNFGASMSLCHVLKVEGDEGLEEKIKQYARYLFAVNICGADSGDTRQMKWDRLIQPLGKGTFDTYNFMKSLWDNGYEGPVGLQCYNLKGDFGETLEFSMKSWKGFLERYSLRRAKGRG